MEKNLLPSTISLGVFDIDGTIKNKDGIPSEIITGFNNLHEQNILTTIMTGRGYSRLLEGLKNHREHLISPNIPIGLENGGRITDSEGNTLRHSPLTVTEIDDTLLQVEKDIPEFLLYYPLDARKKATVWCPESMDKLKIEKSLGNSVNVNSESFSTMRQQLIEERPSMLVIKFNSEVDMPSGLNSVAYEGVVTVNNDAISKGSGVTQIAELSGRDLVDIFVAGNDENDRKMFELPVGYKILVGDLLCGDLKFGENLHRVNSPVDLGLHLNQI